MVDDDVSFFDIFFVIKREQFAERSTGDFQVRFNELYVYAVNFSFPRLWPAN